MRQPLQDRVMTLKQRIQRYRVARSCAHDEFSEREWWTLVSVVELLYWDKSLQTGCRNRPEWA